MSNSKVVVIGKTGQVATELQLIKPDWIFLDRSQMDLEKNNLLPSILSQLKPSVIINAAAYTKVDLAEDEKTLCQKINVDAVAIIAQWCYENSAKFIHISTDYVFDGKKSTPYGEQDLAAALNYYGLSKLLSEQLIAKSGCKYSIIRTSWIYSKFGHNFLNTMLKLIPQKNLNIVFDQVGTPTYAGDIAKLILEMVNQSFFTNKIYHYSHEGVASWYDFAQAIKRIYLPSSSGQILPILSKDYPQKAVRPTYSVLNKQLIKAELGIEIPHWIDGLSKIK